MSWSSLAVVVGCCSVITFGGGACGTPESIHLKAMGGRGTGASDGGGDGPNTGGALSTGGVLGGGGMTGSGGALGTGGMSTFGSGGAVTTGGTPGGGGVIGSGGALASSGGNGSGGVNGGGQGVGGRSMTGGAAGMVNTGGQNGGGGRAGSGGAGGATCITGIRAAGYSSAGHACSACMDHATSIAAKCISMIDCLSPRFPVCTANVDCWNDCLNKFGDATLGACVQQIIAVCGN